MVYDPNKPDEEQDEQPQAMGMPQVPAQGAEQRKAGSIAGPEAVQPSFNVSAQAATPANAQTMGATSAPPQGQSPDLMQYAAQWMAQPSRFDHSLVRQGMDAINAEAERGKDEALKTNDERMSSRGLVGSSIEADSTGKMLAQIEDDRLRRMWEVNVTQANTLAQDRAQAGNFALGASGQQNQFGLQQRALDLQQQGLSLDEAYRRAQMEQQGNQFGQSIGLQREQLVGSQALQQRALDLQQQGMSRDDAFRQAQLEQQSQQFQQGMGLTREQMAQQGQQFQQNLGLQREQLLGSQQLQSRALDLQQSGMSADQAFRQAQLEQQGYQFQQGVNLENRALDLQRQGMSQDDAYRRSALESDNRFRQIAADLQRQGMGQDEAFRQAELQWRQQFGERQQDMDYLQTLINMFGADAIDGADVDAIMGMLNGTTPGNRPGRDPNSDGPFTPRPDVPNGRDWGLRDTGGSGGPTPQIPPGGGPTPQTPGGFQPRRDEATGLPFGSQQNPQDLMALFQMMQQLRAA